MDITLASITDGLSNTMLISEAVSSAGALGSSVYAPTGVKDGGIHNVGSGQVHYNPVLECATNGISTTNRTLVRNPARSQYRGQFWSDGRACATGVTTVLPPNQISCSRDDNAIGNYGVWTPTSFHTGGVNCGVGDGSVRFVSNTVNARDTNIDVPPAPNDSLNSGPSPYGVWGNFGARNSGASTSLP
jgi:hypothetical protein